LAAPETDSICVVIGFSQAARGDCVSARRTLEPLQKLAAGPPRLDGADLIDRGLSLCAPHDEK